MSKNNGNRRRASGTLPPLVGGSVFLVYYHTGFTDDLPELLDVCDSEATASAVIQAHKRSRDRDCEYEDTAIWWMKAFPVRTANGGLDRHPGGACMTEDPCHYRRGGSLFECGYAGYCAFSSSAAGADAAPAVSGPSLCSPATRSGAGEQRRRTDGQAHRSPDGAQRSPGNKEVSIER